MAKIQFRLSPKQLPETRPKVVTILSVTCSFCTGLDTAFFIAPQIATCFTVYLLFYHHLLKKALKQFINVRGTKKLFSIIVRCIQELYFKDFIKGLKSQSNVMP